MAIKTFDELMESFREYAGDRDDDATLAIIEDMADTFADATAAASGGDEWRRKYEENDAAWRKRYKERFYGSADIPEEPPKEEEGQEKAEEIKIEELFE